MKPRPRHISRRVFPKQVPVIIGAPELLVAMRETRGEYVKKPGQQPYQTNRDIKYWSTFFLLKALSKSSLIQQWISQKNYILTWLQMNENTFRKHLAWLKNQELCTVEKKTYSIRLCSYEKAADLLGIVYDGTYDVAFSPAKHKGVQTFQYLIRTEEFEYHKQRQLDAISYKLENNPALRTELFYLLCQQGGDGQRLTDDTAYFVRRLLRLQTKLFREGSDILSLVMTYRADCNRGVKKIKQHHGYKSMQSVSYLKRRMFKLGFARILKVCIQSDARSRLYVPADADTPPAQIRDGKREGYKYSPAEKKTLWFLTDQVNRMYQTSLDDTKQKAEKYAA